MKNQLSCVRQYFFRVVLENGVNTTKTTELYDARQATHPLCLGFLIYHASLIVVSEKELRSSCSAEGLAHRKCLMVINSLIHPSLLSIFTPCCWPYLPFLPHPALPSNPISFQCLFVMPSQWSMSSQCQCYSPFLQSLFLSSLSTQNVFISQSTCKPCSFQKPSPVLLWHKTSLPLILTFKSCQELQSALSPASIILCNMERKNVLCSIILSALPTINNIYTCE